MRASIFLLAAVFFLPGIPAARAGARLKGPVKYEITPDGASVAITTALIDNSSREDATGALQVQLWATDSPYQGGTIDGYLLGSSKLDGLSPGETYKDRRMSVPYSPPAKWGTYAVCVTLLEYKNGMFVIVDHANLPGPVKLGPLRAFLMEGPFRWQTSYEGGTLEIGIGRITHQRKATTGSLKVSVWACEEPYSGGPIQGNELGSVQKDGLKPGSRYDDLKNVAKFTPPPGGTYHIVFTLSEFGANREFSIVDYYNQPDTVTFPAVKKQAGQGDGKTP